MTFSFYNVPKHHKFLTSHCLLTMVNPKTKCNPKRSARRRIKRFRALPMDQQLHILTHHMLKLNDRSTDPKALEFYQSLTVAEAIKSSSSYQVHSDGLSLSSDSTTTSSCSSTSIYYSNQSYRHHDLMGVERYDSDTTSTARHLCINNESDADDELSSVSDRCFNVTDFTDTTIPTDIVVVNTVNSSNYAVHVNSENTLLLFHRSGVDSSSDSESLPPLFNKALGDDSKGDESSLPPLFHRSGVDSSSDGESLAPLFNRASGDDSSDHDSLPPLSDRPLVDSAADDEAPLFNRASMDSIDSSAYHELLCLDSNRRHQDKCSDGEVEP